MEYLLGQSNMYHNKGKRGALVLDHIQDVHMCVTIHRYPSLFLLFLKNLRGIKGSTGGGIPPHLDKNLSMITFA